MNIKDKALEIITNSSRKLNPIQIIKEIKEDYSAEDLRNLLDALDELSKEGLIKSNSGNNYFKNDLIMGILDVHEKGNAHLLMPDGEDIFIPRNQIKNANDKDKVLIDFTDKRRNEGKVVKVLERSLGKGLGEVYVDNGELKVKCVDDLPYNVKIDTNNFDLVDGLLVKLKYVKDIDKNNVLAVVDHVIAHKNAPDYDTRLIANEFDIPVDFSKEALEESKKMPKSLSDEMIEKALKEGVVDLRNKPIVTIDGKDTKDIDDAVLVEILPNGNYRLVVSIADVGRYVKRGSELWAEAEQRGNSNYLGDKVIPMLPIELSNGICSLNENVDRFAVTSDMEIDHSGNVVNSSLYLSIINSKKKMNYDAVQDIIENKETEDTKDYTTLPYIAKSGETLESIAFSYGLTKDELKEFNNNIDKVQDGTVVNIPVKAMVKNMYDLSKKLRNMKKKRGALEFLSDEVKYIFNKDGKAIDVKPHINREAESIIEDFMISANESVAKICPSIFRVHGNPFPKAIEEFLTFLSLQGIVYKGKIDPANVSNKDLQNLLDFLKEKLEPEKYKAYNNKLLRCMQKAYYSTENIGHFGIASKEYTHFTSPIRRFSDLLLHTTIREFIINKNNNTKNINQWSSYLTVMCKHISETERISKEAEYAMDDMLGAEVMEGYINEEGQKIGGHVGEEYDAIIDSCLPNAFFIRTSNYINGRIDLHTLDGYYEFNERSLSYSKNGKTVLRYGDKIRVKCISASKERRQVDFALIKKVS